MKLLDVPTASISEVKRSPRQVFALADESNNAVYVFNHGTVAGVMLTEQQFESLYERTEQLEEKLLDMEAALRLTKTKVKTRTDAEVRGADLSSVTDFDPDDGWA
jgi:PHD/YefM family antitoxin component YafN of YafNO toxin-antitoxin module